MYITQLSDQQRTDFTRSEFLAAARRVLTGAAVSRELMENFVLYCLRHGISPVWVEDAQLEQGRMGRDEIPAFYAALGKKSLPGDLAAIRNRLADICEKTDCPSPVSAGELIRSLASANDESAALAADPPCTMYPSRRRRWMP